MSIWGRPVDLSAPQNRLGVASFEGYVQFWREIDSINVGRDFSLPLRFEFSTGRDYVSPYLGKGFWMPLLESNVVQVKEDLIKTNLLCGKTLYMVRNTGDKTHYQSPNGEWKGISVGKTFTISRDDGWQLVFDDGKIQQLTTDTRRTFDWQYQDGIAIGIKEQGSPQPVLTIHRDAQGAPDGVSAGGKLYAFHLDKRPQVVQVAGQMIVKGFDQSLSLWSWPSGKKEVFEFGIKDNQPDLTVTDAQGRESLYVWDAQTKRVSFGEGWKYAIESIPGNPYPRITRTNDSGKSESVLLDTGAGTTTRVGLDGKKTITSTFTAMGPLYDKVRKIEELTNGESKPLVRMSYDSSGRLIRQTGSDGRIVEFQYDAGGKLIGQHTSPSPSMTRTLQAQEETLLAALAKADRIQKDSCIQRLADFYVGQSLDFKKAVDLAGQTPNRAVQYYIRFRAISDPDLSNERRVEMFTSLKAAYPEHYAELDRLIAMHSGHLPQYASHFDEN